VPRMVGRVGIDRNEDDSENSAVIRAWRKILKGEQPSRPRAVAAFGGPNRLSLEARSFGACQRRSRVVSFPLLIAVSRHRMTFV
jgi:hypothetical protein